MSPSRLLEFPRRFFADDDGASAIMFALLLPIFVGFLGLGTEVGMWYMVQRQHQSTVDVAAYTAALEISRGEDNSRAISEGTAEAVRNGLDLSSSSITYTFLSATEVEVEIVDQQPRLFSALFSEENTIAIPALARAGYESGGTACVLALSTIEFDALTFTGNTSVNLEGCSIMSNSAASTSILQNGSSDVTADCVYAVGGIDYNNSMDTTGCDNPVENATPTADPYADLEVPSSPEACTSIPKFKPSKSITLEPGRYCGKMSLKGDVFFAEGTYIFEDDFEINAQAVVDGSDVTIVMTGGGELQFNGGAEINLSAPTSGDYSGILLYQDRASEGLSNTINGNSSTSFQGAMYFPASEVKMLGGGSVSGGCTQLIADTIYFSGETNFEHDCDDAGTTDAEITGIVELTL